MDINACYKFIRGLFARRNFRIQPADIEDIFQNAALAAVDKGCDIQSLKFRGFMIIASMKFMSTCKRTQGRFDQIDPDTVCQFDSTLEALIESEQLDILDAMIDRLPEAQQQVVRMTLDGYGTREISDMTGVNYTTVSVQKNRAVKTLNGLMT